MHFNAAVLENFSAPLHKVRVRAQFSAPTDVFVRILASSLCHTDLEAAQGHLDVRLPIILGHEACGVVEWVGSAVQDVKPGDRVVLSWNPHCGACFYCRSNQPILCDAYRAGIPECFHFDGSPRLFFEDQPIHNLMYTGSFAEAVIVPASCAVPVPSEIDPAVACMIGCCVMTGVGAVLNVARVAQGSTVTVIGCGAVGLSAIQGARLAGARNIIAVDSRKTRLGLARTLGATEILLAGESLADEHRALTRGKGADTVIEAAGSPAAFRSSLELVRSGGEVVWLGKLPVDQELSLRWGSLMNEKRIIRSSYGGANPQRDFPMLAQAHLRGELHLEEYITSRLSLEDINLGLRRLEQGLDIRPVITFP